LSHLFKQSYEAKLGIVLLILAIVGLLIAFLVPWMYSNGDKMDEEYLNIDMEYEDDAFGMPDHDHYKGRAYLSVWAFVITIIISMLIVITGLVRARAGQSDSPSLVNHILGKSLEVPAALLLFSAVTFMGLTKRVIVGDIRSTTEKPLEFFQVTINGFIMLMYGLVLFIFTYLICKRNENPDSDDAVIKLKKVTKYITVFSVIALICIPMVPLLGLSIDEENIRERDTISEGSFICDIGDCPEDIEDAGEGISKVILLTWLIFFASIFGYVAMICGETNIIQMSLVKVLLASVGAVILLLSLFSIWYNITILQNLFDFVDESDDYFVINYLSMIWAVVIPCILAIFFYYTTKLTTTSGYGYATPPGAPQPGYQPGYQPHGTPPPPPPPGGVPPPPPLTPPLPPPSTRNQQPVFPRNGHPNAPFGTEPQVPPEPSPEPPSGPMTTIQCPGCSHQMEIPKTGKPQNVKCENCNIEGEITV